MGLRQVRLADEVRDILARVFLADKLHDKRLNGVTITHVKLSADLETARVYFRVYQVEHKESAQKGLDSCKGFLRSELAGKLKIRRTPQLFFTYDDSIEKGSRIEELLRQAKD
tara:strand:- start:381 stop:719 length:339 start_codon:yes stop_codon:yes gene_type:complete